MIDRALARCWILAAVAYGGTAIGQDASAQETQPSREGENAEEPAVCLRFEGLLPGCVDPGLAGTFRVDFALYRSPQGGRAIWNENLEVRVEHGRMNVELGKRNRISLALHEETFKFLGASVNGASEVYPRFAVVNVVFVSAEEAVLAAQGHMDAAGDARAEPARSYARPEVSVSHSIEAPSSWRAALLRARVASADLPDYEDWYAALAAADSAAALERAGHYEWVLPWVYDPASHGRYQAYFRGRFQGCDYMDLSPNNLYGYRLAFPRKGGAPERDSSR